MCLKLNTWRFKAIIIIFKFKLIIICFKYLKFLNNKIKKNGRLFMKFIQAMHIYKQKYENIKLRTG